jgi:hypothetical protein
MRAHLRLLVALIGATVLAGCQSLVGPASIAPDRINYADAIGDSWKQEMLLNIVKLRYFDTPVFLDLSSIISSYQIEGQFNVAASLLPKAASSSGRTTTTGNTALGLGAGASYLEHPTITYTPLTGEKFVNALLKPLPPQTIFAMIESGHPADFILEMSVDAINGIQNSSVAPARMRVANPTFALVVEALRRLQEAGALGMRVQKQGTEETTWISFPLKATGAVENDILFVMKQLNLRSSNREFLLTFGMQQKPNEIALLTRSMQEIFAQLGGGVQVPKQDIVAGRATPAPTPSPIPTTIGTPLIRIHASRERPADAYTAAFYRDRWWWIDDDDLNSKRIFMFLLIFSSLAETGIVPQTTPIITIPAN